jgi:NAD(P)H dehydrogenase (quinone)
MKTLIITAHPSKFGFTQKIAEQYAKGKTEKGDTVEILDLYKQENKQDFFVFENIKEVMPDPTVDRMQKKIAENDELVFVFPMWWFAEPAILKNFLDKNLTPHFAYQYENGKPVGLLKGKTAKVFITSDGPKLFHFLLAMPIWSVWGMTRLRFCGIKMESFQIFDKMIERKEESRKELLEKVYQEAKK